MKLFFYINPMISRRFSCSARCENKIYKKKSFHTTKTHETSKSHLFPVQNFTVNASALGNTKYVIIRPIFAAVCSVLVGQDGL